MNLLPGERKLHPAAFAEIPFCCRWPELCLWLVPRVSLMQESVGPVARGLTWVGWTRVQRETRHYPSLPCWFSLAHLAKHNIQPIHSCMSLPMTRSVLQAGTLAVWSVEAVGQTILSALVFLQPLQTVIAQGCVPETWKVSLWIPDHPHLPSLRPADLLARGVLQLRHVTGSTSLSHGHRGRAGEDRPAALSP